MRYASRLLSFAIGSATDAGEVRCILGDRIRFPAIAGSTSRGPERMEQRQEANKQSGEERWRRVDAGKTISKDNGSREPPACSPQLRA